MMKKLILVLAAVVLAVLALAGTALASTGSAPASSEVLAAATPTAAEGKAWLGASVVNLTAKLAERFKLSQKEGVIVSAVTAKGPAAAAGVKVGDLVSAVNGVAVKTPRDVIEQIGKAKPGDTVTLNITRGAETLSIKVTAGTAPARLGRLALPNVPPELKGALEGVPLAERFSHNYGSTRTYKDKDGNVKTVYAIPGVVTAISPTSITITPNNPQGRAGPFAIDGVTRIVAGARRIGSDAIAVGDKVIVSVLGDSSHAMTITKVQQAQAPQGGKSFPLTVPSRLRQWLQRNLGAAPGSGR
jgi:membrane-associated protease RseP (regulator of RpoE activity)